MEVNLYFEAIAAERQMQHSCLGTFSCSASLVVSDMHQMARKGNGVSETSRTVQLPNGSRPIL